MQSRKKDAAAIKTTELLGMGSSVVCCICGYGGSSRLFGFLDPCRPDRGSFTDGGFLSIADDRRAQKRGIFEQLFELRIRQEIGDECRVGVFFVEEQLDAADAPDDTLQLSFAQSFGREINGLKGDMAFPKEAFCFFRIEAFGFPKNLNIHRVDFAPFSAAFECNDTGSAKLDDSERPHQFDECIQLRGFAGDFDADGIGCIVDNLGAKDADDIQNLVAVFSR